MAASTGAISYRTILVEKNPNSGGEEQKESSRFAVGANLGSKPYGLEQSRLNFSYLSAALQET